MCKSPDSLPGERCSNACQLVRRLLDMDKRFLHRVWTWFPVDKTPEETLQAIKDLRDCGVAKVVESEFAFRVWLLSPEETFEQREDRRDSAGINGGPDAY
jgi:hypothetical protein